MSNKQRGLLVVFILIISTVMISACTQSLSIRTCRNANFTST